MPANFTEEQRAMLYQKLIECGYRLGRELGLKKMTIDRITEDCGIAKGTFYHFFKSKEEFVMALLAGIDQREQIEFVQLLNGREKVPIREMTDWYRTLFTFENNFLMAMTTDDFVWMKGHLSAEGMFHPEQDKIVAQGLLNYVDGVREDYEIGVVVNMIKTVYAIAENRDSFCQEAIETNIDLIFESLYHYLKK